MLHVDTPLPLYHPLLLDTALVSRRSAVLGNMSELHLVQQYALFPRHMMSA